MIMQGVVSTSAVNNDILCNIRQILIISSMDSQVLLLQVKNGRLWVEKKAATSGQGQA